MSIHVGRRISKEGWISFETDIHLTKTRRNIYERCLPCLERLREQLISGKGDIELLEAFNCWKITAVLDSMEQCEQVMLEYQRRYPDHYVYGKYGTGNKESPTRVISFHTDTEKERDIIFRRLKIAAAQITPVSRVFISRACANVYAELLGDWKFWSRVTTIKKRGIVPDLINRINRMLYYTS